MAEPEPAPPKPKISVVVVSHNRAALLRRCLESLLGSEDRASIQFLVVDSGSTDGSAELESEFPDVRFILLPRNFGLTKALNIGVRAAEGEFILLLHEDTQVPSSAARQLVAVFEAQPEVGAVCPLLVDSSGTPVPQVGSLPPMNGWTPAVAGDEQLSVSCVTGAAMMFRGFFLRAIRQIDERYGQFGSDIELCWQVLRSGKRIVIVPQVRVVHHGQRAENALLAADRQLAMATYLAKHRGMVSGVAARTKAILKALAGLRLQQVYYLAAGQKVDGSQG